MSLAFCQPQPPPLDPLVAEMNPLLLNDRAQRGAGVISRVTPVGTNYVAGVVAQAFAAHFADVTPLNVGRDQKLTQIPAVSLERLALETLQLDRRHVSTSTMDGVLRVKVTNVSISASSHIVGVLRTIRLRDAIAVKTQYLQLEAAIAVNRNSHGNPFLKLDGCKVRTQGIKLVTKPMDPRNGKMLADAIAADASTIFSGMLCAKIDSILMKRVNQRFALLPSKISLEDSRKFDIVKIIIQAEERMKRQQSALRRRPSTGRPTPIAMVRSRPRAPMRIRNKRQQMHILLSSFNFSRADNLMLDYAMLAAPSLTARGIELITSGEVFRTGHTTPFGAGPISLLASVSPTMLQIMVSDFVPNSLMYHGHRIRLFDTRIDWNTPQFGPVMRTTCDLSTGSLFCIGDLFPALRDMLPGRNIAFLFSTLKAPAVIVQPEENGGIHFNLIGLIRVISDRDEPIGEMEIRIEAFMKMKLTSKVVKGKVTIEEIQFTSRTPRILLQEELDDAGFLSREILQRMVNDILRQGVPIPIHPLFKLVKPKLTLARRAMLLETNFLLNEHIIAQLTAETLVA
ncbi:unnamed protein product [Caenorhabditis bovis]|uniref:Lipid-binding serum glycoprotein C-terminal domain-containing protein n=1 Tax=Caenorhabditis bovis TaxID=2654633 RepID=A0A8S1EVJ0_9PELO|nr:unnamed protein product [Caenorhabditis bovis]